MMKLKFLLILILCILLSGCIAKQDKTEKIKFSTWGSASEMNILVPIIKDFEQRNPNIKIDLIHIPQNYFQKLHLLFASNLAPDVIFINNLNLPIYANHLLELNYDTENYYTQSVTALSYNNHQYAIPRDVSNLVIFYNKDLFDKNKIQYPNKNWNIDDLLSLAKTLTNDNTWGISYEEDMYYALPYILAYEETIYDKNIKDLNGIKFYKNLVKLGIAPSPAEVGSKTVAQLFLEGKIAMHLSGRWLVPKYTETAKFNWSVINFPASVPCDASGWAIAKNTKHKKAAYKFIEFISSKENITKITNLGLIVPARKDVKFEDEAFIDSIIKSKVLQITPDYNKYIDYLNDTIFLNKP